MKLKETKQPDPYPHKFNVTCSISNYVKAYGEEGKIKAGEKLEGVQESPAGRIHNIRASGASLRFYDLHGEGQKVQIMANKQYVPSSRKQDRVLNFPTLTETLRARIRS